MFPQSCIEFIEGDAQGVRAAALENLRTDFKEFDSSELAHVIVKQCATVQHKTCASVLAGFSIPEQFACHSKMDIQDAAIEIDQNLFAASPHAMNRCVSQRFSGCVEPAARDTWRKKLSVFDCPPHDMRSDGAHNGFDFW